MTLKTPDGDRLLTAAGTGLRATGIQKTVTDATRNYRAQGPSGTPSAPLFIICHGGGGDEDGWWDDPITSPGFATLRTTLAAEGWIQAAGLFAGEFNFGNTASREDLAEMISWVDDLWQITDIVLYGISMGGLLAMNYAADGNYDSRLRGCMMGAAVQSIVDLWSERPEFQDEIEDAFGFTGNEEMPDATLAHDPMRRPVQNFSGLRYRWYSSPDDTFVEHTTHAVPMQARVDPFAIEAEVVVTSGDHVTASMSAAGATSVSDIMDFLDRCTI